MPTPTAAEVFRDSNTIGVPASGPYQVLKAPVRSWGAWLESLLGGSGGGLGYQTRALLYADLGPEAHVLAIVYGDSTAAYNGVYEKVGAADAGSWTRIGDLPNGIIRLTQTGGSANAIVATATETPSVPGNKLYILQVDAANTGATTIAVNGAAAVAITNALGTALAANSLLPSTQSIMAWNGTAYQLLISANVDASAILAAAQAAQLAAEEAQEAAEDAAADAASAATGFAVKTVVPFVFDMMGKALRGVGWDSAEGGGNGSWLGDVGAVNGDMPYTLASGAAAGATVLTFTGTLPLANQLIVYLGTDNEYYSVSIRSLAGNDATINCPLQHAVASGQKVWAFYVNEGHPGRYGYRAIADELIRQALVPDGDTGRVLSGLVAEEEVYQGWLPAAKGTATITEDTADNTFNPGSATAPGYNIAPGVATDGGEWTFYLHTAGQHRIAFRLNAGNDDDIFVRILFNGSGVYQWECPVINDGYPQEFFFEATDIGRYSVQVFRQTGTTAFKVSHLSVRRLLNARLERFSTGTHVFFGDSWFAISSDDGAVPADFGIIDRFRERFPAATFINEGVGGTTAALLVARINADVLPHEPDFVHICVSTNDIYAGVTAASFSANIGILRSRIMGVGAIPIMYTGYVGSASGGESGTTDDAAATARFQLSRLYARDVTYWSPKRRVTRHSICAHIAAGVTARVASLGVRRRPFMVGEHYLSHTVSIKEGATQPCATNPPGGATTIASGFSSVHATIVTTPHRFVQLVYDNSGGGAAVVVEGYVDIQEET